MRISEIISEAKDVHGDCFKAAGRNMTGGKHPDMKLVHAYVSGQGPLEGRRFEHAWNEVGDNVIDNSNGRNIVMPKVMYYRIGNVNPNDPKEYRMYDQPAALKHMIKTRHWGPWELG